MRGLRQPTEQVTRKTERRESVRQWLTMTRQLREITGAAEFSAMPLDEVERVRAAYGTVRVYAGNLFSRREAASSEGAR